MTEQEKKSIENGERSTHFYGMTKREIFAMMALQGLLSGYPGNCHPDLKIVIKGACLAADNLLLELEKTKPINHE